MKKPAFGGRASSVACNPILAPSCLVVDAAMAHLHLDLLHKKDVETRLRAITYKGGGLSTIKVGSGRNFSLYICNCSFLLLSSHSTKKA